MADPITLFLCGDVMTGRGIDQVLPTPSEPLLHEAFVRDARLYVELAESVHGPIERFASPQYVWGAALALLADAAPDARIVNLETSVTRCDDYWPGKGIHYRMHPANVRCLTALGIDCCTLANNHVLDWGSGGLAETFQTLRAAGVPAAGAGRDVREASAPAVIDLGLKGRVLVFACGTEDSGIPSAWAAGDAVPGVHLLPALTPAEARSQARAIDVHRRPGDLVVVSVHWGDNWGYAVPEEQRAFAHALIDSGRVDVVHGHSSHHAKGIEIHRGRPILYGCGDFLNDYEGIQDPRAARYRSRLAIAYLLRMSRAGGPLASLRLIPFEVVRFRLQPASTNDLRWLKDTLDTEGADFGTGAEIIGGTLHLRSTDASWENVEATLRDVVP